MVLPTDTYDDLSDRFFLNLTIKLIRELEPIFRRRNHTAVSKALFDVQVKCGLVLATSEKSSKDCSYARSQSSK